MGKKFFIISCCTFFSIGLVVFLFFFSNRINHRKNGFIRLFQPHSIGFLNKLDIQYNSYYLAGLSNENIYLGNVTLPNKFLIVNHDLKDSVFKTLNGVKNKVIDWRLVKTKIDSPYIYVTDGTTSSLLTSNLLDDCPEYHNVNGLRFTAMIPVSQSSLVIRNYSNSIKQNILTKVKLDSPNIRPLNYRLEKQLDGLFCTDGMLHYAPDISCVVYIYCYRNEFACLDTNLNLLYKANTIDTISRAQIKIANLHSGRDFTMAAPPLTVNNKSCVSGELLFINSGLRANNEGKKAFARFSVIDIYSLKNGKYKFSFYLPDYKGRKLDTFQVYGKTLVAIYDHYLLTYLLKF